MSRTFKDKWQRKYNHIEYSKISSWKIRLSLKKIHRRHNNDVGEDRQISNKIYEKIIDKDMRFEKDEL